MLGGVISGTAQGIGDILGSNAPPKAILNRYAAPTVKGSNALVEGALKDTGGLSKSALDQYLAGQGKQQQLAGQQENVLGNLMGRRLNADPNALLRDVGNTAFGFINPDVVSPLAQLDVNTDTLNRRARGLNPAAVDSTADRLRKARVASGRYYDVARDVYNQLPNLYGQAYGQGVNNENLAAGYIPQIAGTYENVAKRPTTGIRDYLGTIGQASGLAGQQIGNVNAGTQGFAQQKNFADRLSQAGQDFGSQMSQDENKMLSTVAGSL